MKGWKTAILLADGRVVSAYDRRTEWGPGVENVVAPPTGACVGLNDSASVDDALSFVGRCSLCPGERLVLMRTGGERGVVIRSARKHTCERLTSVHAWLCERDEAWPVCDAAKTETEAQGVYNAARNEAQRRRNAARDEAQRVYGVAVRKHTCRKPNKLW